MKTKSNNQYNYVDALETEHHSVVLTKPGRIQILVQPTAKQLRKRGKKAWRLFSTVENGLPDAGSILTDLTETIQRAIQEMDSTSATVENNGKKHKSAKSVKE